MANNSRYLVALLLLAIFCATNGTRCCGSTECNSTLVNATASGCPPIAVLDNCMCINYTQNTATIECMGVSTDTPVELQCNVASQSWSFQMVHNITSTTQINMTCACCNLLSSCQRNLTDLDELELCKDRNNPNGNFASGQKDRVQDVDLKIGVMEAIIDTAIGDETCAHEIRKFICGYIFPECDADYMRPMAPCYDYCAYVIGDDCESEWTRILDLLAETTEIYEDDPPMNPLGFLGNLMPSNCGDDSLSYYDGQLYSNNCVMAPPVVTGTNGTDLHLENIVIGVTVAGVTLILILLVAIFCVVGWWYRCRRGRAPTKNEAYHIAYRPNFTSRTATLLGWPFVHPRASRFKGKNELFKMVPQQYMDILSDQVHYLIQPSKVHTTVFLAEGTYSEVYQGYIVDLHPHQTSTYRTVTIKRFKEHVHDSDILEYLESALKISNINHPNILKVVAVTFDHSISIIYSHLEEHDLLSFLKKKRTTIFSGAPPEDFSVRQLVDITLHIALGMAAIAEMGIPYKMLSAHTCMVDKGSRVVVGDVSMYLQMAMKRKVSDLIFHRWMAPEGIKENIFTEKSDVWSYGVTAWEVFTLGSYPYNDVDSADVEKHVANGNRLDRPPLCPETIFSLMERCWAKNPRDRPFFNEIADTLNDLLHVSEFKDEIASLDERLREGNVVEGGGVTHSAFDRGSPHIGLSPRKLIGPVCLRTSPTPTDSRNLYLSLRANEPVYLKDGEFSPEREIQGRDVNADRQRPSSYGAVPVIDIQDDDDYENCNLGPKKRHSLGAAPSGTEAGYYNLPKGYIEALRKKTKSSSDVSKPDRNQPQSSNGHKDEVKSRKREKPRLQTPVAEKPPVPPHKPPIHTPQVSSNAHPTSPKDIPLQPAHHAQSNNTLGEKVTEF